ncbi:MAG: thiamine biosynthesis protein [Desulfomonilia bacterium]
MKNRCVALYSGGLDSILAIKLIEEQDIDVVSLYFCTPFYGFDALMDPETFRRNHSELFGIDTHVIDFTDEMLRIVKSPSYGFGKHLNPCIDCKIGMLRKARSLLGALDASFVITGEVVGQRPMSQRKDAMRIIERDSGLKSLLLRPLCAKRLPETLPEREGVVERELLGSISGRGRKEQMVLAQRFGIKQENIPNPAGGCLLTDERIAGKIRQTYDRFSPELPPHDEIILDVVGRKFLLDETTVLVVSRNEEENKILSSLYYPGNVFLKIADIPGPLAILRGAVHMDTLLKAAGICLRYSKARGTRGHTAIYGSDPFHMDQTVEAPVFPAEYCKSFQIDENR